MFPCSTADVHRIGTGFYMKLSHPQYSFITRFFFTNHDGEITWTGVCLDGAKSKAMQLMHISLGRRYKRGREKYKNLRMSHQRICMFIYLCEISSTCK